ncbi:MAG: hypothetical protein U0526_02555 [Candidatus Saccharibacteria bacterium]|jgi:hypothetical protein
MTLERIDAVCGRPFRAFLHGLCYVTGRSNFFFARLALLSGFISFASYAAVTRSWPFGIFTAMFAVIVAAELINYALAEQQLKQSSGDILPSFLANKINFRRISRVGALGVVCLNIGISLVDRRNILLIIAWLSDAAMLYFSEYITPRGKSLFRRAVDWAKSHAPSFNLNPAPRPEIA